MKGAVPLAVLAAFSLAAPAFPQEVFAPDPPAFRVGLSSRNVWRGLDRGGGVTLRPVLVLPVSGSLVPGPSQNGVQFEAQAWIPLSDRGKSTAGDQLAGTLRYLRHVGGAHGRSFVAAAVTEYYFTDAEQGSRSSHEVSLGGVYAYSDPRIGLIPLSFYSEIHRDLRRLNATYVHAGVSTSVGVPYLPTADIALDARVSWSDYPGRRGPRGFGFHAAELQAFFELPVTGQTSADFDVVVGVGGGLALPAQSLGADFGWWEGRLSLHF